MFSFHILAMDARFVAELHCLVGDNVEGMAMPRCATNDTRDGKGEWQRDMIGFTDCENRFARLSSSVQLLASTGRVSSAQSVHRWRDRDGGVSCERSTAACTSVVTFAFEWA